MIERYDNRTSPNEPRSAMTKREEFAKVAMHGICMNADYGLMNLTMVATDAVRHADALIEALNKEAA
jgi:hypothetical protein